MFFFLYELSLQWSLETRFNQHEQDLYTKYYGFLQSFLQIQFQISFLHLAPGTDGKEEKPESNSYDGIMKDIKLVENEVDNVKRQLESFE